MVHDHNQEMENRIYRQLLDVLIKAGLILALAMTCYTIFSPFMGIMLWALILAVALYPLHQRMANRLRGNQGFASTLLIIGGIVLIAVPCILLMSSLADSITSLIHGIRDNTLHVPPPADTVAQWPLIGDELHQIWDQAANDLPGLIHKMQPKIGDLSKKALAMVASMGTGSLKFLFSFIIAGVIMAYGKPGAKSALAISRRIIGKARASEFTVLCTATIRTVAQGVIGIAFIQAILVGLVLYFASIPATGILAAITLVFGIAQIPAALITIPSIIYLWSSGDYTTSSAILFSVLLVVAGTVDNILKPMLLGRGVDAPMPVILLGALGGMITSGILGMFIGATMLALGYQIFIGWVAAVDSSTLQPEISDRAERPGE